MDWSKAKSILIIIFVALNLFLAGILMKAINEEGISQDTIDNAKKALLNRGVVVNSEIPLYNKKLGILIYGDETIDKNEIIKNFLKIEKEALNEKYESQNNIEIDGERIFFEDGNKFIYKNTNLSYIISAGKSDVEVFENLKPLFKGTGIPINQFVFDKMQDENTYIFRQKYNNFWIFENYIFVHITKEGISYLECKYKKVSDIIQGKEILAAHQILIKNHDSIKDIEITAIDLGFKENIMQDGTIEIEDIPVWRIKTSEEKEMFFRVYDGEKIDIQ